ncbi:MAG: sigma-70 family RNA polymerase sigma factor [Myxococcaceae bacterium]
MSPALQSAVEQTRRTHGRFLWGLCYRMTGSAADADELVQETFTRALQTAPKVSDEEPLEPWLTRVAMNLSRDRLKRRKQEGYVGPYLPAALPDLEEAGDPSDSPEARYGHLESLSFAFLLALESLPSNQRAVLLLRDVAGLSVEKTAQALELTESNVKVSLMRARESMESYHSRRFAPTRKNQRLAREALERFFGLIAQGEWDEVRSMLSKGVRGLNDGGGQYFAARKVLVGPDRNLLFLKRLMEIRGMPDDLEIIESNGFAAVKFVFKQRHPMEPGNALNGLVLGPDGKIDVIYSLAADRKVDRVFNPSPVRRG